MKEMSLNGWLDHIQSFHPQEIELGLARIRTIAKKLELLNPMAKVVMVGGTNGKGSVVATLEAIAKKKNLRVASYTSPHLLRFNERIKLNGTEVEDEMLVKAFTLIESIRDDLPLTFFEFTTLAALWVFKQSQLDLIILEVGLGGRLDAVNIIDPDVSLITTIALDHTDWLGNSLAQIASEKAGIIRAKGKTFIGDSHSYELVTQLPEVLTENVSLVSQADVEQLALIKDPQVNQYLLLEQNIMLALDTFKHLFPNQPSHLKEALEAIEVRGRFQRLSTFIPTIVDVAHNPQAAENLKKQLKGYLSRLKKPGKTTKVVAICGMMSDKSIEDVLLIMDEVVDEWGFVDLPIDRAASAQELMMVYQALSLQNSCNGYASVEQVYKACCQTLTPNDLILVFGSFITVADMFQYEQSVS
ncbi:bifunctional folylpolyglutamate synthase/dihydrofolate synthase [Aliikangiella sp. IMCC44359]|uniref:bifunctional folylpolyglutamate synthase/dihydrofolate synthase n=1 Tax=Aliikangiella sp. IMCC44359 TaxID=3459125 RepID=UPI00403AA419